MKYRGDTIRAGDGLYRLTIRRALAAAAIIGNRAGVVAPASLDDVAAGAILPMNRVCRKKTFLVKMWPDALMYQAACAARPGDHVLSFGEGLRANAP